MKYVQFTDSTETTIVSVFGSPQDQTVFPNQGTVEDDDPRYLAFMDPSSTPAAILQAKIDKKAALLTEASQAMTPVFLALQLGDATDNETVQAKAWRAYYNSLVAVDVTVSSPAWPTPPAF
jgi:hypothetical protein